MKTFLVRISLLLIALVVIGYPLSSWYQNASLAWDMSLLATLFPAFGLVAFTVMYLHIIGRPFAHILERYVPWKDLERYSSYLVLLFIILHPALRTIFMLSAGFSLIPPPAYATPILLGFLGFLMLITYDLGKSFNNSPLVMRHWNKIDLVSTLGFYVILFHSLALGGDLQEGNLRTLWIFFGLTAAIATLHSFVLTRPRRS